MIYTHVDEDRQAVAPSGDLHRAALTCTLVLTHPLPLRRAQRCVERSGVRSVCDQLFRSSVFSLIELQTNKTPLAPPAPRRLLPDARAKAVASQLHGKPSSGRQCQLCRTGFCFTCNNLLVVLHKVFHRLLEGWLGRGSTVG